MALFAKHAVSALLLSWTLLSATFEGAKAFDKPRGLVVQENQEACDDHWGCWNGNSWIFPLWMSHEAIYWRCNEPGIIALGFEDAIDTQVTPLILDELKRLGITATFFVNGRKIDDSTKDILVRADAEGHTIASHAFDDASMLGVTEEGLEQFLSDQVIQNEIEIEKHIPSMKKFLRPPYLGIDARMADALETLGYKVVMRNIETYDYNWRMTQEERWAEVNQGIEASEEAATQNSFITSHRSVPEVTVATIDQIYQAYKDYYTFVDMETCLASVSALAVVPSDAPSTVPSDAPSTVPSDAPSTVPSDAPSTVPSDAPSLVPSDAPSAVPSDAPSTIPTQPDEEITVEQGYEDNPTPRSLEGSSAPHMLGAVQVVATLVAVAGWIMM